MRSRSRAAVVAATILTLGAALVPPALADPGGGSAPPGGEAAVDLDVLFIGAHPDDEAGTLAALGQWNEFDGISAGVITVTRGEGGGNAVGLEEGPELGILREAEERRAVGHAGIEHVYNLDKVDFFYTASSPLTAQAWDGEDALERVVRVIRATRPEVIITMNPSPTPGNHGNHQEAARLAVEGYYAAADPAAFAAQITDEGMEPWAAGRVLRSGASGQGEPGAQCATTPYRPTDPTDRVFGAWAGRMSEAAGETWAALERRAQWEYVSQGWAAFPPAPTDPDQIACDWFTLIDSRTPYPDPASGPTAAIQGAALPAEGGLPLGTRLEIEAGRYDVLAGEPFDATVHVQAPDRRPLVHPELAVTAPEGWQVEQSGDTLGTIRPGGSATVELTVTPPAGAAAGERAVLAAELTARGASGRNETSVQVANAVRGGLAPRPEVAVFEDWTAEQGLPKLRDLITPLASVGTGRTQEVAVEVVNDGTEPAGGTVRLDLADGFSAEPAERTYTGLAPGETATVTFAVTNDDTSLPTSNRAPDGGYPLEVVTTSPSGTDTRAGVLELVPTTEVPRLEAAPEVDGTAAEGEYPGEVLDSSTRWEGEEAAPEDASAATRVSFTDDALYLHVEVADDTLGTVLAPEDCRRHWRTDSVEITIDPRGSSANTATTFKTGIFPITDDPAAGDPPCFQRDADNNQGPGEETAPGMEVASVIDREDYDGYAIEAMIPFDALPDTVDPERMGLNVLVYDSDTDDRTGQTRIGWATYSGVQADPFRWGLATLPGLAAAEPAPVEPTLPDEAASSTDSPQSIAQSAADGVPLGGGPGLPGSALRLRSAQAEGDTVRVGLRAGVAGRADVFVWDGTEVVGRLDAELPRGASTLEVPVTGGSGELEVLVAYTADGASLALSRPVG
ncbi:sugar-binding protein [Allonocardiopsis opalescens]|uniref:Alpha-galactosidase-like protein n=1 Tax=Allonocardiopsis opalescens TaxID=1144618 RepID=A0A2T0Q0L8_9ACTN|nr:sugar-binding protein [Allonocardiopsis opalescens]PRX97255.1 alpha-galactosidase-like protein [Allonocardiopsis opalescens]